MSYEDLQTAAIMARVQNCRIGQYLVNNFPKPFPQDICRLFYVLDCDFWDVVFDFVDIK